MVGDPNSGKTNFKMVFVCFLKETGQAMGCEPERRKIIEYLVDAPW